MNRKETKNFLEILHFHGYIDHDITKLDNLIDTFYVQKDKADVYYKAIMYAKSIYCDEYDNPAFYPDVLQTIRDYQIGYNEASQ